MANLCSVSVKITGSKKQLKKIKKIIKGEVNSSQFNHFKNSSYYMILSQLDRLNLDLKNKKNYNNMNELVKDKQINIDDKTKYIVNIEDLLYFIYDNIEELSKKRFHSLLYSKDSLTFLKELIKCLNVINPKSFYDENLLGFERLSPDNPIMFYRETLADDFLVKPNDEYFDNWYSSRLQRIGCKWFPDIHHIDLMDDGLFLYMETPWSPPIELFQFITEMFDVEVTVTYDECGEGYIGKYILNDGKYNEIYSGHGLHSRMYFHYIYTQLYELDDAKDYLLEQIWSSAENEGIIIYDNELRKMDRKEFKSLIEKVDEDIEDWQIKDILDIIRPKRKVKIRRKK